MHVRIAARGLILILATSCASRGRTTECRFFDSHPSPRAPGLADLSAAKAYRDYVAVTRVEPAGHHFTVWYQDVEPAMMRLRVGRDGAGHLSIEPEGGYWGGLAAAPQDVSPLPPEVAVLADEVEADLRSRCVSAGEWQIAYQGLNRTVEVEEFIAHDVDAKGTRRVGWVATTEMAMDAALTRIVGTIEHRSGFGTIEIPADAQWLMVPASNESKFGSGSQLSEPIAEAARRYDARVATRALASLVSPDAPMLPPGFVSRVRLKVSLYGRAMGSFNSSHHDLIAHIDLHDAVFAAAASVDAESTPFKLRVTLTPATPRSPTPGQTHATYAGTLAVHVEDDRGHAWDHSYPASGRIDLEGNSVVAPYGLLLPGGTCPSPECDALQGRLPAPAPNEWVDVHVGVELFNDPRR